MKDRNFSLLLFNVYDCEGIENYLEKQAENGWMLEKVTNFGVHFRKTEPKKVKFSVNFLPKGSMFESEKSKKYEDFKELSEHNGWKLVSVNSPHMYFVAEQENPVPIETDPVLKVETAHNVMKKMQLPLFWVWIIAGILNFLGWTFLLMVNGLGSGDVLVDLSRVITVIFSALSVALVSAETVRYSRWHKDAIKLAEEENIFLNPKGKLSYVFIGAFFQIIGMAFGIISTGSVQALPYVFAALVWVFGTVAILYTVSNIMKKHNASEKKNRIVFIVIFAVICVSVLCLGLVSGAMSA